MILRIENLHHSFGGIHVLRGVNLDVKKGEILAIIGPNGSGKTTLFNIISGILNPKMGRVVFKEKDLSGKRDFEIARLGLARTFQVVRIFPKMTCIENVMVAALIRDEVCGDTDLAKLLAMVGLFTRANDLASSLTLIEKKKLELARALATNPKLLLLDEVMSGLNFSEMNEAIHLIQKINSESGVSMIWIEHVMQAVMKTAHRVAVLSQGKILALGLPEDISKNPEVIEAYLGGAEPYA